MRKGNRLDPLLFVVITVLLIAVSCNIFNNPGKFTDPDRKKLIIFAVGTGDFGGTFYPVGETISKIINEHVYGVKAYVEMTGGSMDNARMVGSGELLFGLAIGDVAYSAYNGEGHFSTAHPNLTCLFATYSSISQWVTLQSSPVNTVEDLRGEKIAVGMPGSGSEVLSRMVLKAAGINYPGEIVPLYIGVGEGAAAVRDGLITAAHTVGGIPFSAYESLAEEKPVKFLPLSQETIKTVIEETPYYYAAKIPARSYAGQLEEINTLGVKCLFLANKKDVSDELAYQITKAVWENMSLMISGHPSLRTMTEDFVATDLPVPLHPGAERYWREVGIIEQK